MQTFHPSVHNVYFDSKPTRLTFQCAGCGAVYWHQAYYADDVAIKNCKKCGKKTHQHRYYPEKVQFPRSV